MSYIVLHQYPDWDALTSAWLLWKYYFNKSVNKFVFVNTDESNLEVKEGSAAVVDTGMEYNPDKLRFDHHQLENPDEASATLQVYRFLYEKLGKDRVEYLEPLIHLVHRGDIGEFSDTSEMVGLHAMLSARVGNNSDESVLNWAFNELNLLSAFLQRRDVIAKEIDSKIVWSGEYVTYMEDITRHHVTEAYKLGYNIVSWNSEVPYNDKTMYYAGIKRSNKFKNVMLNDILRRWDKYQELVDNGFYFHNSGFYVGYGSEKAPRYTPMSVNILEMSKYVDEFIKNEVK